MYFIKRKKIMLQCEDEAEKVNKYLKLQNDSNYNHTKQKKLR